MLKMLTSLPLVSPELQKRVLRVGVLWVGSSESSLWLLLTLLIGCDIM